MNYEPRLFVMCGARVGMSGRAFEVGILADDETIQKTMVFKSDRNTPSVLGGVYKGASFSDKGISGINRISFVRRWKVEADIIEWQALDAQAKEHYAAQKLEKDAARGDEILRQLVELRRSYQAMAARGDYAGCAALKAAVISRLSVPLRKYEE